MSTAHTGTGSSLPRHLYVHAPFCARRCSYCDFAVHVAADPPVAPWARGLGLELAGVARAASWSSPLPLRTVYLGGGTPSLLGVGAAGRMLDALAPWVGLADVEEFTAEANPESFTPELGRDWVAAGVNRVSFGAQTFHEPSLRWMGRLHGPEGAARAVATARSSGLTNVGLDLIFGLPSRLERDLGADLDRILALEPDHVSVYGLSVEEGTPLGRWVAEGRELVADQDRYGDEYLQVSDRLRAAGYEHYEVSNFARPGRWSRHNAAYWNGAPYLGLGNGAHSYVPPRRWWNRRDWAEYRSVVEAGGSPRAEEEVVGPDAARLERIWLGLRTREGLDLRTLAGAPGEGDGPPAGPAEPPEPARARVADWLRRGWAEATDVAAPDAHPSRVRLTPEGWLLLDRLTVELDEAVGASA